MQTEIKPHAALIRVWIVAKHHSAILRRRNALGIEVSALNSGAAVTSPDRALPPLAMPSPSRKTRHAGWEQGFVPRPDSIPTSPAYLP